MYVLKYITVGNYTLINNEIQQNNFRF